MSRSVVSAAFTLLAGLQVAAWPGLASAAEVLPIPAGNYRALFANAAQKPEPIAPFWLDRLPVTNSQFTSFLNSQPRWQRDRVSPLFADASDRLVQLGIAAGLPEK